jgi:ABC-type lipoprotein export system ATPase subunit
VPALTVTDLIVARDDAGPILEAVSVSLSAGALAAVTGPSGAGKTTLLHAIAGLVRPSAGAVRWDGHDVAALSESRRDRWRRESVGMVFQDFQLIPEIDVIGNVLLPLTFDHWRIAAQDRARARNLLDRMGLDEPTRRAGVLSRGEQQRVAIARALIRRPTLLLADEPTASLDPASGARAASLLIEAARESGASLIVVSHDGGVLDQIGTIYQLKAGRLTNAGSRP